MCEATAFPNGTVICNTSSQDSYLLPGSYAAFATYLKNFATQFQSTFGALLYALSPQNEPNLCSSDPTYGFGASYTGAQLDTFIKNNLGPTLAGTGVKIMMPETTIVVRLLPIPTPATLAYGRQNLHVWRQHRLRPHHDQRHPVGQCHPPISCGRQRQRLALLEDL
jgi:hypothetical protein